MQCLRNWATKFQFHKGNRGYTFVELAIIWLSAICIGIIATYGHNYHVSEPLWCIVFIAVGYILIQLGRMIALFRASCSEFCIFSSDDRINGAIRILSNGTIHITVLQYIQFLSE